MVKKIVFRVHNGHVRVTEKVPKGYPGSNRSGVTAARDESGFGFPIEVTTSWSQTWVTDDSTHKKSHRVAGSFSRKYRTRLAVRIYVSVRALSF